MFWKSNFIELMKLSLNLWVVPYFNYIFRSRVSARIIAIGLFVFILLGKPSIDLFFDNYLNSNQLFFTLLFSPILAIGFLIFEPSKYWVKFFSFFYSSIIFFISCILVANLDFENPNWQLSLDLWTLKFINIHFIVGLDTFSSIFIVLTSFLFLVTTLSCWANIKYLKFFFSLIFVTQFFLFLVFSVADILLFYIAYEAVIVPIFLLIGFWGGRFQRIYAAYLFFYYTFAGSIAMLFSIIYIYLIVGSTSLFVLYNFEFTTFEQICLFIAFFIAFASKLPLYPLHSWLPEAHVEAPTAGSVLLAGILLKMGGYGIVRWCLTLFPIGSFLSVDYVNTIGVISILYASFTALQQLDIKRIIAYSSIAHMSYVVIGLFTFTEPGLLGSIFLMVSHGIISGGLFLCIGVLYDRYGTRSILYYGGLGRFMPVYDSVLFILCLSNIALPGTAGFPGEFMVLYSVYSSSPIICFFLLFGVFLTGVYTIWMYCRLMMYNVNKFSNFIKKISDISSRELIMFIPVIFLVFFLGVFPNFIFVVCRSWVSTFLVLKNKILL